MGLNPPSGETIWADDVERMDRGSRARTPGDGQNTEILRNYRRDRQRWAGAAGQEDRSRAREREAEETRV